MQLIKAVSIGFFGLAITACTDTTSNNRQTDPRPKTGTGDTTVPVNTNTGGQVMNQTNQAPTVGVVSPVTVTAGQYITGILDADDPNRATGDRIASIEFSTVPSIISRQLVTATEGQTKHSYSIFVPAGTTPQSLLGIFTVTDSHGMATTTQFAITVQGTSGQPTQSLTKEACGQIIPLVKTGDITKTLLTLGCNFL